MSLRVSFVVIIERMKKLILILPLAVLLLSAGDLLAQRPSDRRWEVDFSLGGQSMLARTVGIREKASSYSTSLKEIYAPYYSDVSSGTVFCLSAFRSLKPWFEAGVDTGFDRIIATRFDPVTERETGLVAWNVIPLMGGFKAFYFNDFRYTSIYAGLSLGASFTFGRDTGIPFSDIRFAGEVIPFGFRIGPENGHWRLVVETVAGTRLCGGRVGVGYRI